MKVFKLATGVTFIAIGLKLLGVIPVSWIWVLAPLGLTFIITIIGIIIVKIFEDERSQ